MVTSHWYFYTGIVWQPYNDIANFILEYVYIRFIPGIQVYIHPFSYWIDFVNMKQTNMLTETQRVIKRLTPVSGTFDDVSRCHGLDTYDKFLHLYTYKIFTKDVPKDSECLICLMPLIEPPDVENQKSLCSEFLPDVVCGLKKCLHMFHLVCIVAMLESTSDLKLPDLSITCSICKTIHGIRTGDQPSTGSMKVAIIVGGLPGYEKFGAIEITYNFNDGMGDNGIMFIAAGFPRVCYIPNCQEGQLILKLLELAWNRRLIFTVGTSVTTGLANCIIWNDIHHKTEPYSNLSGHGFPDPKFLENIKMELASLGVTEDELFIPK